MTVTVRDDWPPELWRLVEKHGPAAVYAAGLKVLGYPPTWAGEGREYRKVWEALQ